MLVGRRGAQPSDFREQRIVVSVLALLAQAGVLASSIVLVQLIDQVILNPGRAGWLKRDGVIAGAAFGAVALLSISIGLMVSGGLAAGLGLIAAVGLTIAAAFAIHLISRRFLRLGGHLASSLDLERSRSPGTIGTAGFSGRGGAAAAEAPAPDATIGT